MHYMYASHRVEDYRRWREVFDAEQAAQRDSGLHLLHCLVDSRDPNFVMMLFRVDDPDKALAFTRTPAAAEAGRAAGVVGPAEMRIMMDPPV